MKIPAWALIISSFGILFLCGNGGSSKVMADVSTQARPAAVTAIDVALEPDATMIGHATAANAALLKVFPKGFALGPTRQPHVTVLQQYVRTADLPKAYAALAGVFKKSGILGWKLKAYKYYLFRPVRSGSPASSSSRLPTYCACSRT